MGSNPTIRHLLTSLQYRISRLRARVIDAVLLRLRLQQSATLTQDFLDLCSATLTTRREAASFGMGDEAGSAFARIATALAVIEGRTSASRA